MKKKESKKLNKVMVVLLIVILLSSTFSLFNFSNEKTSNLNIQTMIVVNDELLFSGPVEIINGSFIYQLVQNFQGSSFESDGDLKSLINYQNNFLTNNNWQMFVDNKEVKYDYLLKETNTVLLHYGTPISFFNISLFLNINGIIQSTNLTIQEGFSLQNLLTNYGATINGTNVVCLFDFCNNENSSWTYLINEENDSINYLFEKDDFLSLIFD